MDRSFKKGNTVDLAYKQSILFKYFRYLLKQYSHHVYEKYGTVMTPYHPNSDSIYVDIETLIKGIEAVKVSISALDENIETYGEEFDLVMKKSDQLTCKRVFEFFDAINRE